MRTKVFVSAFQLQSARVPLSLLAMIVFVMPAMSQSTFSDPEAASPYGGVAVTVGELAPGGAPSPFRPGICGTPSPNCVLTGQYNRGRQGQNLYEPTLAGYGSGVPNTFTNINYYALDSLDYYTSTYNPIMAQPLWISYVPIDGSPVTTWNVLIAATLNDSVYAFAADGSTFRDSGGDHIMEAKQQQRVRRKPAESQLRHQRYAGDPCGRRPGVGRAAVLRNCVNARD